MPSKSPENGARGKGISVAGSNSLRSHCLPKMRWNQKDDQVSISIGFSMVFRIVLLTSGAGLEFWCKSEIPLSQRLAPNKYARIHLDCRKLPKVSYTNWMEEIPKTLAKNSTQENPNRLSLSSPQNSPRAGDWVGMDVCMCSLHPNNHSTEPDHRVETYPQKNSF